MRCCRLALAPPVDVCVSQGRVHRPEAVRTLARVTLKWPRRDPYVGQAWNSCLRGSRLQRTAEGLLSRLTQVRAPYLSLPPTVGGAHDVPAAPGGGNCCATPFACFTVANPRAGRPRSLSSLVLGVAALLAGAAVCEQTPAEGVPPGGSTAIAGDPAAPCRDSRQTGQWCSAFWRRSTRATPVADSLISPDYRHHAVVSDTGCVAPTWAGRCVRARKFGRRLAGNVCRSRECASIRLTRSTMDCTSSCRQHALEVTTRAPGTRGEEDGRAGGRDGTVRAVG